MNGLKSERGQGLVEYALILIFVAIVVIIAVTALGEKTSAMFSTIDSGLQTAISNLI